MERRTTQTLLRLAIKTPTVALLIILITATALTLIVYNVEVDLYLETKGEVLYNPQTETYFLQVLLESPEIQGGERVIWYLNPEGHRYQGEVEQVTTGGTAIIALSEQGAEQLQPSQTVTVEIFLRKVKVIEKIMKYQKQRG